MTIFQSIKHYFRSTFREFFVYHNSSLEFRAKIIALVVGANDACNTCDYDTVYEIALDIYHQDVNRATTLLHACKEYVNKVHINNNLGINELANDITKLLKTNPRFAMKIDTHKLQPLLKCHEEDADSVSYQENILEFLDTLKAEHLPKTQSM